MSSPVSTRVTNTEGKEPPRSDGQMPQAVSVEIHGDAVDISTWRVHFPHPVSALVDSRHRLLSELLRLAEVGREQVKGSHKPLVLGLEELLEAEALHHVPWCGDLHLHCANP